MKKTLTIIYKHRCSGTSSSIYQDPNVPAFSLSSGGVSCIPVFGGSFPALTKIVESSMQTHTDGLPKPIYCNGPSKRANDSRCGWTYNSDLNEYIVATTGKWSFDKWYRDDVRFSKRVSFALNLSETASGSGVFTYQSRSFHPINSIAPCTSTRDMRLDCSNGGKLWPRAVMGSFDVPYNENTDPRGAFAFTTEIHTFFTFVGNETFEFEGDDDVWIYINEHLALDVGGLHTPAHSVINLTNSDVQKGLGLELGGVYALDIFHAERKTVGSTFMLTTSLQAECNVIDAASADYILANDYMAQVNWKSSVATITNKVIYLLPQSTRNIASFAFLKRRLNVGPGFIATFNIKIASNSPYSFVDGGFAFVIHRTSTNLDNLNGGSGPNFGFARNFDRYVSVLFDFTTNQIKLVVSGKVLAWASLHHPNNIFSDGNLHNIQLRFYAQRPPWLEVYIDGDLFLQKRGIALVDEILASSTSAWVGFTAGAGSNPSPLVQVSDFIVKTVMIEDSQTRIIDSRLTAIDNGKDAATLVVQTFDLCGNPVSNGGSAGKLLASGVTPDGVEVHGEVFDQQNGRYTISFRSNTSFKLGELVLSVNFGNYSLIAGDLKATFLPPSETLAPTPYSLETGVEFEAVKYVAAALSTTTLVCCCMIGVGLRYRRNWRFAKQFVIPGRDAAADQNVIYNGNGLLDDMQKRVERSFHELQAERFRQNSYLHTEIEELNEQIQSIRDEIRLIKGRQAVSASDVSEKFAQYPKLVNNNKREFMAVSLV
jgi:fibro-slime domain-containing protein